jgi:hypothetical protein
MKAAPAAADGCWSTFSKDTQRGQGWVHDCPPRDPPGGEALEFIMPAIGCFLLIVLPLLGLFIGGAIHGKTGCEWGAGIGFGLAMILCVGGVHAFIAAARRVRR